MRVRFRLDNEIVVSKHHGLGNDFLVLLDMANKFELTNSEIVALLDRRTGIGADGLIRVIPAVPDSESVATMILFNSDGSRAEISGNGIRCLAQALVDADVAPLGKFSIDTDAGMIEIESHSAYGDTVSTISVGMGMPDLVSTEDLELDGVKYQASRVDIGNPHLVLIPMSPMSWRSFSEIDIAKLGPRVEATYPNGMNVEWVIKGSNLDELELKVWERGAGVTLACGTGTTVSAYVANRMGLVGRLIEVHNPGGVLSVEIGDNQCYLRGPAQRVGEIRVSFKELRAMVQQIK